MEKIQQALDRAKRQRESADNNVSSRQSHAEDVQSIIYTRTQAMEGHAETQRENRILSAMEHSKYADAFKILSTQVMQRMEEHQWSSLAVTSVGDDEGKQRQRLIWGLVSRKRSNIRFCWSTPI